ncbi:MAG: hypothetical protein Sapg2KO_28820 [Saprospiraceae bacterium]
MIMRITFFVIGLCALLAACSSNTTATQQEQTVEEIMAAPSIRNSDIVRSPVSANAPTDTNDVAKMTFQEPLYDYGEVLEGAIVEHTFTFTNTGTQPLLISNARSTCGCTVPEWPKNPILPGEDGEISVKFNTANKKNQQTKPVNITANTYPSMNTVYLRGTVKPKENS